ncbi:DUF4878 domain-containing protein [Ruminococcus sp.]|uniref:DUF4878 domain-containing protein n=1 Tax=Ruminococcus sp. TaxID=41978 RepID=UPI001B019331|nr:DUF4878 domain-containing protein [Ruminococcus sp.]MBO5559097.1 hypothetical protein [Ruminococcus sp.]
MKKIVFIVASLLLLGISVFFSYKFYHEKHIRKTAEKTVVSFINVANDQNLKKMLEYIEPTEAQIIESAIDKLDSATESTAFTKFKKWLPYISDFTELKPIPQFDSTIVNSEIQDKNANITVTLTNRKTSKETECVFYLIDINGTWYIQYAIPKK